MTSTRPPITLLPSPPRQQDRDCVILSAYREQLLRELAEVDRRLDAASTATR